MLEMVVVVVVVALCQQCMRPALCGVEYGLLVNADGVLQRVGARRPRSGKYKIKERQEIERVCVCACVCACLCV